MKQGFEHRPDDFKRRILKRGISKEKLHEEEYLWLKMIKDEELGKKYYNLNNHHFNHWHTTEQSNLTVRQKLSEASKKLHQDPAYREKFLEGRKKMPAQTPDQISKRVKSNTGKKRTEETKQKISESNKGKVMGPLSDNHKKKLSEALKGEKNPFFGKQHDPELKKRMNEKTRQTLKGRMPDNIPKGYWWNNGSINKRSTGCPGDGWLRGRASR
jgi:hypothetical protein